MEKAGYKVVDICRCLSLASSCYYYSSKRDENKDSALKQAMLNIQHATDNTYGKRRMLSELLSLGYQVGLEKVRRLMREQHIYAKRAKRKHHYTSIGSVSKIANNHLNRCFSPKRLNQYWAGDITYIRTGRGWLYLSVIMDLCSRRVVSYAFSNRADSVLTMKTLSIAVQKRNASHQELLFHSDQGCQYSSQAFQNDLKRYGIKQSMSRAGQCLDNAVVERFFRSLKQERVYHRRYRNHLEATQDITDYIELFYNQKRRHSFIGNISPVEYELTLSQAL